MDHSLSYSQIKKLESKGKNRLEVIGVVVMFVLYCIVSNMSYNDCIIRGVC
jgi:hypothetical protein